MTAFIQSLPLEFRSYLTAVLTSITCGLVGTYIVIKRMSFISGGITHASFGGIGIAYFLGLNPVLGAIVFGILSGLGIEFAEKKGKMRSDSAIAMLWSVGMAIGILFIYITPGRPPNLISYLFGSILTVSDLEVILLFALGITAIIFFSLNYKNILFTSFDADFARSRKFPVDVFDYSLVVLLALTIVLNIRVIGIILVMSLLTIPQNIVLLFTYRLKSVFIYSVIISIIGTLTGIYLSSFRDIPTGAIIILIFFVFYLFALSIKRIKRYFS